MPPPPVVINAGCANAATGQRGIADAEATARAAGEALDLDADAAGVGNDVGLLDAHPGRHHALVAQAGGGDLL